MYMKKILSIIAVVIAFFAVVVLGWYYFSFKKYAPVTYVTETENGTTTINTATGTSTPGSPTYTMETVATHNTAASCYSVIAGNVYDLTLWVNMHPGGKQPILMLCGKDGTIQFESKHTDDARPSAALARFKIGRLAQ